MVNFPTIPTVSFTLEYDRTAGGNEVSTAVAELPKDVTIRLRIADHFMLIRELEHVERDFTILAHPAVGAKYLENPDPRIERPEIWYSPWSADFYGVVSEVAVDPLHTNGIKFDVLNVGIGRIYLHPSIRERLLDSDLPLEIGDELYVPTSLLEVWEVVP